MVLQPCITELCTDIIYQLILQCHTGCPNLFIGNIVDSFPNLLVALVTQEFLIEILRIEFTPLCSCPCGEVYTVSNVTNVVFFWIIAFPNRCKHLLAHPSVKLTYTVNLLAGVASKGRHTELLVMVIGIDTTHTDEFIPTNAKFCRIATHILAKESFIKVVVSSRNWSMNSIQTRSTNEFQCLVECQTFLDVIAQTLQVTQSSMSFITMINIFLNAQFLES